jgi:hypothetical protein
LNFRQVLNHLGHVPSWKTFSYPRVTIKAECGSTHLKSQLHKRQKWEDCSSRPVWTKKLVRHYLIKHAKSQVQWVTTVSSLGGRDRKIVVSGWTQK